MTMEVSQKPVMDVSSEHAKGEHTPFIDGVPVEDLNVIEKISKRGFDLILSALSFERGAE